MSQQNNLRLPELNNVILVGRLTHDPEVRFTAKGQAVCRFSLAVNSHYKDTAGNWHDDTSFIPVVVWGESANRCGERLKKGFPVQAEGKLQSRAWETKDGQKRTSIEVIARRVQFLSRLTTDDADVEAGETGSSSAPSEAASTLSEEEIPF